MFNVQLYFASDLIPLLDNYPQIDADIVLLSIYFKDDKDLILQNWSEFISTGEKESIDYESFSSKYIICHLPQ